MREKCLLPWPLNHLCVRWFYRCTLFAICFQIIHSGLVFGSMMTLRLWLLCFFFAKEVRKQHFCFVRNIFKMLKTCKSCGLCQLCTFVSLKLVGHCLHIIEKKQQQFTYYYVHKIKYSHIHTFFLYRNWKLKLKLKKNYNLNTFMFLALWQNINFKHAECNIFLFCIL